MAICSSHSRRLPFLRVLVVLLALLRRVNHQLNQHSQHSLFSHSHSHNHRNRRILVMLLTSMPLCLVLTSLYLPSLLHLHLHLHLHLLLHLHLHLLLLLLLHLHLLQPLLLLFSQAMVRSYALVAVVLLSVHSCALKIRCITRSALFALAAILLFKPSANLLMAHLLVKSVTIVRILVVLAPSVASLL